MDKQEPSAGNRVTESEFGTTLPISPENPPPPGSRLVHPQEGSVFHHAPVRHISGTGKTLTVTKTGDHGGGEARPRVVDLIRLGVQWQPRIQPEKPKRGKANKPPADSVPPSGDSVPGQTPGPVPSPFATLDLRSLVVLPHLQMFPIEQARVTEIRKSMQARGYDPAEPLRVWRDGDGDGRHVLLDGHTRRLAAIDAKLTEVPVVFVDSVTDQREAFGYAYQAQKMRRNLSREAIVAHAAKALLEWDGARDLSAVELGALLGVSDTTIARIRSILDQGNDEEIDALLKGGSVKKIYLAMRDRLKREEADRDEAEHDDADPVGEEEDDDENLGGPDPDAPEALLRARDIWHDMDGRLGRLQAVLFAESWRDSADDIRSGVAEKALADLDGLIVDLRQATGEVVA